MLRLVEPGRNFPDLAADLESTRASRSQAVGPARAGTRKLTETHGFDQRAELVFQGTAAAPALG